MGGADSEVVKSRHKCGSIHAIARKDLGEKSRA